MKKIKNLCVTTSEYQDKNGNKKTNWLTIGSLMQKDDGNTFILLSRTFNPAGVPNPDNKDSVFVNLFDLKNNSSGDQTSSDDSIPF